MFTEKALVDKPPDHHDQASTSEEVEPEMKRDLKKATLETFWMKQTLIWVHEAPLRQADFVVKKLVFSELFTKVQWACGNRHSDTITKQVDNFLRSRLLPPNLNSNLKPQVHLARSAMPKPSLLDVWNGIWGILSEKTMSIWSPPRSGYRRISYICVSPLQFFH